MLAEQPGPLSGGLAAPSPFHPFVYADTASPRASIEAVTARLRGGSIGIVGLGGTGSYVLDLVAKTPVERIVMIDGDRLEPHNAFRAPGAISAAELAGAPPKVSHFATVYARMHGGIIPHPEHLTGENLHLLDGLDFVFCCADGVESRALIVPALEARGLPFIDCGLGLTLVDDALIGLVRVTTSTPTVRDHVRAAGRIPTEAGDGDLYRSNIQVADMNALAAALAVMRWKRLAGFYLDLEGEYNCTFSVDGNHLRNDDHFTTHRADDAG